MLIFNLSTKLQSQLFQLASPIYILPHKIWFSSILFSGSVNRVVFAITTSQFIGRLIGTSTIIITGCIRFAPGAHIRWSKRCLSPAVIGFVINNISFSFISAFDTYDVWAIMKRAGNNFLCLTIFDFLSWNWRFINVHSLGLF